MVENNFQEQVNLDQWVAEIIDFHFSESTGSEFWLRRQRELKIDAKKEIKSYGDLYKLGYFDEKILSQIKLEDMIPRAYRNKHKGIRVFETGGSKGNPKYIFDYSYRQQGAKWLSYVLDMHKFGKDGNWLHIGPTGPHSIGYTVFLLSELRNGIFYTVDMDPRWVKKLISLGAKEMNDLYLEHLYEQVNTILNTQNVDYLFITPKLLEIFANRIDFKKYGIKGILSGGTRVSRDMNKVFRKEVIEDIPLVYIYGNTLMGSAAQAVWDGRDIWDLVYYPNYPFFMIDVVEFDNYQKLVNYEERGRIRMTSLNKDFFIPNLIERDEAVRIEKRFPFCCDGVADVRTCEELSDKIIEGVY